MSERDIFQECQESLDSDVYVHCGPLMPPTDTEWFDLVARPGRRTTCTVFVSTRGGSPHVAYKMMGALQHAYQQVRVVLGGRCKSAGTLFAIGADEIAMLGTAELGPLDVQVLKTDGVFERESGQAISSAFISLDSSVQAAFRNMFLDLKFSTGLTTQTAAQCAAEVITGVFAPVYGQIDPLRVGEIHRANAVALEYGQRLLRGSRRNNLPFEQLMKLVTGYPSHDFAIDREEAKELFTNIKAPTEHERKILAALRSLMLDPPNEAVSFRAKPNEPKKNDSPTAQDPDDPSSAGATEPDCGQIGGEAGSVGPGDG